MSKLYKATGLVLGNLWGGGTGAYPARKLEDKKYKGLIVQAERGLSDGWLDSGMGFESLVGALLVVETVETIYKGSKDYSRSDFEEIAIGDLGESEIGFLEEYLLYS